MNPRTILTATLLLCGVFLTSASGEEPLKVFILAGQSNMVGMRSLAEELENDALKQPQENVLFFNGEEWAPLAPGVSEPKGFGPELSFGHDMQAAMGEPIGIIKHSVGGTNLAIQWDPENPKGLYKRLLRKYQLASGQRKIEVIGMIWMQGEADSKTEEMATTYAENLASFVETARKDFNAPEMPFIAGRVNGPEERYPWVEVVQKAQMNCPAPNTGWIDCDGLGKVADNVHYTTSGYVEMGHRFAARMKEMLQL